jgi:hypothetical protein
MAIESFCFTAPEALIVSWGPGITTFWNIL